MKNFKLYAFIGRKRVLVTNSQELSHSSTFDESCSIKEHQQISFSCKIAKYLTFNNGEPTRNLFYDLFYPEGKLSLELYDKDNILESRNDLIIKDCTPTFYVQNEVLTIKAIDYASERFAKRGANLSFEHTGNIKELASEIFAETKVNPNYKNVAKNLFLEYNINSVENCEWKNEGLFFNNNIFSIKFSASEKIIPDKYSLSFYSEQPFSTCQVETFDTTNQSIEILTKELNYTTGLYSTEIELNPSTKYIKLTFYIKGQEQLSGLIKEIGIYQKYKDYQSISLWKIAPSFSLEEFKNSIKDINNSAVVYKRATLSLSGSNFYNALIELCTLFDAELIIDYANMWISFKNKNKRVYRGYKLNPNTNIKTFSRTASSSQLYTVIDVYGGEINDKPVTLLPPMPLPFKQYFWKCIGANFIDNEHVDNFEVYTNRKYASIVTDIFSKPENLYLTEEQYNLQKSELLQYAAILDMVPNFENRIYDIEYFYNIKKITANNYHRFNSIVNNDLRKINIKINLYSEQYYSLLTTVSSLLSEIEFLTSNIVTEEQYLNRLNIQLKKYIEDKKDSKVSEVEWKIRDRIAKTLDVIQKDREQLMLALGIKNEKVNLSTELLLYNILQLYGYENITNNCFTKILQEIQTEIDKQTKQYNLNAERLKQIQLELGGTLSEYQKRNLEVEQAGLERYQKRLEKALGRTSTEEFDSHEGYLILRKNAIQTLFNLYSNEGITTKYIGYEDYLVNYYSEYNLIKEKDYILQQLYSDFEEFLIEGYYENTAEINSTDLAEQAFIIREQMTHPQVTYNVGIIDLSSLENYQFLNIQIGDKIKIDSDELFLEYNPNYQKYITITGITYSSLREPDKTKLDINKQNEDDRLLQQVFLKLSTEG